MMWVALLLPLVVACASGSAKAGCGSYVHILPADGQGSSHPPGKVPCHGPSCDAPPSDSPLPASSGTVVVERQVKPAVILLAGTTGDDDSFASSLVHTSASRPVHRPASVFHPPRVV